jgi:hypothetical protein
MDSPSFSQTLAALGLPPTLLDGVDPVMRPALWNSLFQSLEASDAPQQGWGAASASMSTGAGTTATRREPPPFVRQYFARPRLQQSDLSGLDLAGWHQEARLALWMAAEALAALRVLPDARACRALLCEQCVWIGQLYDDLKRRVKPFLAPVILQGELRFLRHRASAVATELLFAT